MKRKSLLFTLLLALFMPWAANAQESIPYTEGFESMSSASDLTDAGWISSMSSSASFLAIETSSSNVYTGSKALNIDSWDAASSDHVIVGLPVVDAAINTLQITFSYKVTSTSVAVGYLTDANDASTFVQLGAYSSSSSYTTVTKELNEAPATAARIAIKYTGYYRCYIDDIEVKALPTCVKPTLGEAQYISEEGASFQWTENGNATSWVLEYSTDQNFTNATSINRNGIPNYAITGLTAGTLYYVHVKSDCGGGDESDWSNVVTFTTLCEPINAEGYSENFDSYTGTTSGSTNNLPDCWDRINTTSYSYYSGYPNIYSSNASSSPNCLRFYSYYSSWSDYDPQPQYAILPPMNGLAGMQVTLQAKGYNTTSTFKIGTMSDPTDASSFTMIVEQTGLTTSYQEFEYIIPANCHDNCLAIMIDAANDSRTTNGVYIDDIAIVTPPSCIKPTGLEVTATTATTATLSWTNGAEGQTAWQICLNDDESNLIDANSNPFTIDEEGVLSPASTYTAKVRANCGNGDYSDWSNTVTIETPCEAITITESWSENFNNLTAGIPNCWDNSEGTTTTESHKWNYYATGHDGACLRFNSYSNSNGNTNFLKTPTLNFATGKVMQLRFWYKNPTGGDFSVYISTDSGNTYTTSLATGLTGVSSWTQQEINLPDYVDAENVVIVFKGTSNYGNGDAYIYLDDVAIVEAPSCLKPTGLAVTANSITYDGAVITWTAGASETQWQIEFATDPEFTSPLYETVEGEPTYTFHGLDDGTTYFVHVQAVCGGSNGSSEYSEPVSFSTLQTPANLPYATDFESSNDWLFVNGGLTNAWAFGTATSNGEGTHALYISNDGGTTNAYTNDSPVMVYATKLFNFEAGTYVFSYDWKAYGESTYDYLRVALVPSSVTLTAGTSAPSVPSGTFYNNLPTGWIALDGGGKLNLKSDWQSYASDEMEIAAGTYMMVFAWRDDTSSGSNPPAAIDNVSIEVITCTTPTGLTANASGITATSAQLSWTETGEATAWEIELTDADNNVIVIPVTEDDLVDGVYTIEDLTPETIYSAKVRANCGDGYSNWSEEEIFETASACPTPDGLAATATSNSAVISWNGYGQEEFNLRYSTDGETWTTESGVANNYTLADLTPVSTYYVQVQPTCADEETWSAEYSFTTECDVITIAQDAAYTYDFEEETPMTCWTNVAGSNVRSSGSNNTTDGNYKLQFKGTTTGNIVAMPAFTPDINGLMLTFWTRPESSSYSNCGTFSVGYMTDLADASTFVPVATYDRSDWTSNTYIEKKAVFTSAPAGAYIAFCHNALATNYYWYVDDVTVEIAPSYTLTIEAVGEENWLEGTGGYYLIASPVTVDLTNHAMTTGDFDLYAFDQSGDDEGNEWQNYKANPFNLEPGKGYLYAHKTGGTFTLTGEPYSGDGTIDLVYNDSEGTDFPGWNLVGNPWGVTATPNRDFYTMENGGARINPTVNVSGTDVDPMTGIFVVAEDEGESVTFETSNSGDKSANLALNLSNNHGLLDRAIVRFGEGRLMPKFQLFKNSTKLYIELGDKEYAIVNAEEMGEMPVSFKAENNGSYTLSFTAEEVSFAYLHLIDNMTGNDVDLLETPSYSFEAKTTDYANRFKLVFATGNNSNSDSFAFMSNGSLIINNEGNATLQVIDVTGRIIKSESINGCANVNVNAASGVYMLRLVNGDNVKVQKVVVR